MISASGRLMFVTPASGSTPLQPSRTVLTEIWSRITVASGSTSECWSGRSVPPRTTTVMRGEAGSSSSAVLSPLVKTTTSSQVGARDERARGGGGRRADVDQHASPRLGRAPPPPDRSPPSRRRCGSSRCPRRAARDSGSGEGRAAADTVDLPARGERVEVAAHGHVRDRRSGRSARATRTYSRSLITASIRSRRSERRYGRFVVSSVLTSWSPSVDTRP